jgi:hypothetical protein
VPNRARTFGAKLIRLLVLTSALAVVLVCVLWIALDFLRGRDAAWANLSTQADIIASNSTAPLAFRDAPAAQETLAALSAEPNVAAANLFDTDDKLFAVYRPDSRVPPEIAPALESHHTGSPFRGRWLLMVKPVIVQDDRVGTLTIAYDMSGFYNRLLVNALVSLLAGVGATATAILLALRLERVLERPVAALSNTAATVSRLAHQGLQPPRPQVLRRRAGPAHRGVQRDARADRPPIV